MITTNSLTIDIKVGLFRDDGVSRRNVVNILMSVNLKRDWDVHWTTLSRPPAVRPRRVSEGPVSRPVSEHEHDNMTYIWIYGYEAWNLRGWHIKCVSYFWHTNPLLELDSLNHWTTSICFRYTKHTKHPSYTTHGSFYLYLLAVLIIFNSHVCTLSSFSRKDTIVR